MLSLLSLPVFCFIVFLLRGDEFRRVRLRPATRRVAEPAETMDFVGISVDRPAATHGRHLPGANPTDTLPTMQGGDWHGEFGGQICQPPFVSLQVLLVPLITKTRSCSHTVLA